MVRLLDTASLLKLKPMCIINEISPKQCVFGGNKLNCFKAVQVLGGPTQILIWGSEIGKSPTR